MVGHEKFRMLDCKYLLNIKIGIEKDQLDLGPSSAFKVPEPTGNDIRIMPSRLSFG